MFTLLHFLCNADCGCNNNKDKRKNYEYNRKDYSYFTAALGLCGFLIKCLVAERLSLDHNVVCLAYADSAEDEAEKLPEEGENNSEYSHGLCAVCVVPQRGVLCRIYALLLIIVILLLRLRLVVLILLGLSVLLSRLSVLILLRLCILLLRRRILCLGLGSLSRRCIIFRFCLGGGDVVINYGAAYRTGSSALFYLRTAV